jgi:tetratricopeptide (TPR) repeat protein
VPTIWGNVPQRNKNFTGRVDILTRLRQGAASRITAVLPEQDPDDPLPQAVQGLGGVGKTAIAIEYAYRHRFDYDLVWWIPADQLPSVRGSLAALAGRLGLESATTAAGIDGAIAAVLDALRRGDPFGRWLLIFDNADQPEEILDLIPKGPGDVLITSRNHRWQSVINTVSMDVFTRPESIEFLGKRVPKGLSESDADRLAAKLGDLPLALEQAGAMLAETGMPVDEYLRLLDEHVSGIMSEGKSPDYPYSMTAAWKLSVDALQRQLPQAKELLRCCAFFGPEPIPRDVFRLGVKVTDTHVSDVMSDPILLARAIRELGRFALVTLDGRNISVHRLVQALLRDELTEPERAAYRQEVHLILAAATPPNTTDQKFWPRYNELLPHVASESTELARSPEPVVRGLALNMVRYLYQYGDYTSCLELTDRFIAQWSKDSGPDSKDVLDAQRHLGNALRLLGRYPESFRLTEDTLTRARAVLGERDELTVALRNSFGADLRARGKFVEARQLDEETRNILEETLEPDQTRTLRLMASLALDYGLNSGYSTAKDLYLDVYQSMLNPSVDAAPTDVLGAWTGLAWALHLMGEHRAALDVSKEALDYGQDPSRLGPEHIFTLRIMNRYTIVSRRMPDQRMEALELVRSSYDMSMKLFGPSHPDTLAIGTNLSNLLRTMGETDEALQLAEEAIARYPKAYAPDHPYTFGCIGNLALLKRVTGDVAGARELDDQALTGLDQCLGRDHHYTLTVATNFASDLAALKRWAEARAIGEDTLSRLRALLGPDHQGTLACASNLSRDMVATGDTEAGAKLAEDTNRRYLRTFGDSHPDTLVAVDGGRIDPDFDPPPI